MNFISRVVPELKQGVNLLPPLHLPDDLEKARQLPLPPTETSEYVHLTERMIPGAQSDEMLVKIYEPIRREGAKLPALLWIHGGGYVLGHPDADDALCESFVQAADCVVISPDYRLAPEHPFPAGIEDCYAALLWMTNAAEELNIDLSRIAIGGASAGGGLCAALALMARDRGGPSICFQMPLYPMIDDRNITPSSHEITDPAVWNRANNVAAWKMYLGEHAKGDISPYAAPSRANNLAGLPPAYTCVGQLDPFRDETMVYAARLAHAGVDVEFQLYPGCYHGFEHVVPTAEISRRARNGYIDALARAFIR
ncbi:alpha/beta hydrolase [Paenibacillus mesophilus]|uniref:alpha/beta hydrolase n=1 Tax=Paenibacillus mesophilus TaxID=2582849 RepID=UPI00110EE89D|nr:alpha/beta hydrolase [Paenibacillus mesophilus]TMV43909.1 alpha/beta hydrolase [Paenibacillus mesophilus]